MWWKKNKFGAVRTEVDGVKFHSKRESERYLELKLLARAGEIVDLVLQPKFPMKVNDHLICNYYADFAYFERVGGKLVRVVEDLKGMRTPEYKLKAKLFQALYPTLLFRETT